MRDFAHPFIGLQSEPGPVAGGALAGQKNNEGTIPATCGAPADRGSQVVELRTMKPASLGGPRRLAARRVPLP